MAGIGFFFYRFHKKISLLLIAISFLTLWLFSAPIFSYNLIEILQNKYSSLLLKDNFIPAPDSAIVILGGGSAIYVEENNKTSLSDTTFNRVRYGAFLHKKTHLPIIVSGGRTSTMEATGANLMATVLRDQFNIPSVILEDRSINTAEESLFLIPILKEHHFKTIYLITHAAHMPRSVYLFEKQHIQVIPAPMGYETYDHHYSILSFIPHLQALSASYTALHEFIGILYAHFNT